MPKQTTIYKTTSGTAFLIIRQVFVQILNFMGGIYLARNLTVDDYGFFGILTFIFSFVLNFGDIGLAASLIKQNSTPSDSDRNNIFTVQLFLSIIIAIVLVFISPYLCDLYKISHSYSIYFYFISATIFVLAFKTMPTIRLEREIRFGYLSLIEIAQSIVYNGIAISLSYCHWGPYSFTIALLLRTTVGCVLVYFACPTSLKFEFNFNIIKKHLRFGLPYQIGMFVNILKDSISPVMVGAILGMSKTGVVNMASLVASCPSMLLFILNRLFFPAFSRAKDNEDELKFLFRMGIRFANAVAALLGVFIIIMCKEFIFYIFGEKWLSSQQLVYLFWSVNLLLPSMLICSSYIYAKGYPKFMLKYNILTMVLTLGIGIPLIFPFGIYGVGIANVIVNISMIVVIIKALKMIKCSIFDEILKSWLPAIISGSFLLLYHFYNVPISKIEFIIVGFGYFFSYLVIFSLFSKKEIVAFVRSLKSQGKKVF